MKKHTPSVIVLGGGLSGMAAAMALAQGGACEVTIVERGGTLGGLAGTFQRGERFYPLAYHHILHRDRTLLWFLDHIGVLGDVRWRKIRMLFRMQDRAYDLSRPLDFLRFPMRFPDKLRFVRLMLRCFAKSDWSDWHERSAGELVDLWGGPGVRETLFESLTDLKFRLPCSAVSGAWLGARLHFREGSAPLGYIPGTNWTKTLCDGISRRLDELGIHVCANSSIVGLRERDGRLAGVDLEGGRQIDADLVVTTVPTEVYHSLAPGDRTPALDTIRYTAVVSFVCATRQIVQPEFYWMNLPTRDLNACGIFRLETLNPTIGERGDVCLNFVTHVPSRDHHFFQRDDEQLISGYLDDFRRVFGFELQPFWSHLTRLPMYSPVFLRGYRNPPVRSRTYPNVYFAGNYCTFPSIASTGTALWSGLQAAAALLEDRGMRIDLPREVEEFRLRSMPRG